MTASVRARTAWPGNRPSGPEAGAEAWMAWSAELEAERTALRKTVRGLEAKDARIAELEAERTALRKTVRGLEAKDARIAELEAERTALRKTVRDLEAKDARIAELEARNAELEATVAGLEDSATERQLHVERLMARLGEAEEELRLPKKKSRKPKIEPNAAGEAKDGGADGKAGKPRKPRKVGRRGRRKGRDKARVVEVPYPDPPPGSKRKDFRERRVQALHIGTEDIVFRLERLTLSDGTTVTAEPPIACIGGFSAETAVAAPTLYRLGQSTMPRVAEVLRAYGLDISDRQVKRLLAAKAEDFVGEALGMHEEGVAGANDLSVDDTGARHDGRNAYCTSVGNGLFCSFRTSFVKNRLNFLDILCTGAPGLGINGWAFAYWKHHALPAKTRRIATEGARYGFLVGSGRMRPECVILGDGAGQFDLGPNHQLCWVHFMRNYREFPAVSPRTEELRDGVCTELGAVYGLLKRHAVEQGPQLRDEIERRFDATFDRETGIKALDDMFPGARKKRNKLLFALDRPEVQLDTNHRESAIRGYVTRRRISAGARSETGRAIRDAHQSPSKTSKMHGTATPTIWETASASPEPPMSPGCPVSSARSNEPPPAPEPASLRRTRQHPLPQRGRAEARLSRAVSTAVEISSLRRPFPDARSRCGPWAAPSTQPPRRKTHHGRPAAGYMPKPGFGAVRLRARSSVQPPPDRTRHEQPFNTSARS